MGKLEGISIQNYGPLQSIQMGRIWSNSSAAPLGNVTAIIGPGGSGKSTMADAFEFLADCLNMGVEGACYARNRGGYENIVSQGVHGPLRFELCYRASSTSSPLTYELTLSLDEDGVPYVAEERVRQHVKGRGTPLSLLHLHNGSGYAFEGTEEGLEGETETSTGKKADVRLSDPGRPGVAVLGALKQYARLEQFLNFLKSWYLCDVRPDAARHIEHSAPQPYLNRTGANLNAVALSLYRESKSDFAKVLADMQTKLPGITKIEPLPLPNGQIVLQFYENNFAEPFFTQQMSDGTLKVLAYYLLLHERNPRQLVFLEEPENGLYHHYLADLAAEMRKHAGTGFARQIFVTTHSPFFVNGLPPEDVWVLEKGEDGFSTAKRASDYEFVQALTEEGAATGDLWYNTYFG